MPKITVAEVAEMVSFKVVIDVSIHFFGSAAIWRELSRSRGGGVYECSLCCLPLFVKACLRLSYEPEITPFRRQ